MPESAEAVLMSDKGGWVIVLYIWRNVVCDPSTLRLHSGQGCGFRAASPARRQLNKAILSVCLVMQRSIIGCDFFVRRWVVSKYSESVKAGRDFYIV